MHLLRNFQNRRRAPARASGLLKTSTLNPRLRFNKFRRHETNLETIKEIKEKVSDENIAQSHLSDESSASESGASEISEYFSLYSSDTFEAVPTSQSTFHNEKENNNSSIVAYEEREMIPSEIFNSQEEPPISIEEWKPTRSKDIQSILSVSSSEDDSSFYARSSSISFDEIYHATGISLSEESTQYSDTNFPIARDRNTIQRNLNSLCGEEEEHPVDEEIPVEPNSRIDSEDSQIVSEDKEGSTSNDSKTSNESTSTDKSTTENYFRERTASPEVRDAKSSERDISDQTENRSRASPFSKVETTIPSLRRSFDTKYTPLSSDNSNVHKGISRVQSIRSKRACEKLRKKNRRMEAKIKKHKQISVDVSKRPLLEVSHSDSNAPLISGKDDVFLTPTQSPKPFLQLSNKTDPTEDNVFRKKRHDAIDRSEQLSFPLDLKLEFPLTKEFSWNSDISSTNDTPLITDHIVDTSVVPIVRMDKDPRALVKYCNENRICEFQGNNSFVLSDLENYAEFSPETDVAGSFRSECPSPIPISYSLVKDFQQDSKGHPDQFHTNEPPQKQSVQAKSSNILSASKNSTKENARRFKSNGRSAFTPIEQQINNCSPDDDLRGEDLISVYINSSSSSSVSSTDLGVDVEQSCSSPRTRTISTQTSSSPIEMTDTANKVSNIAEKNSNLSLVKDDYTLSYGAFCPMPHHMNYSNEDHVSNPMSHKPIRTSLRRLSFINKSTPKSQWSRTLVGTATLSFQRKTQIPIKKFDSGRMKTNANAQGSKVQASVRSSSRSSNATTSSSTPLLTHDASALKDDKDYKKWSHLKASDTLTSNAPKSLHFWAMAQKRANEEKDVYKKLGESEEM
jgi:hypothetical protein